MPREFASAPDLLPTLRLYWHCYFDLRRGLAKHVPLLWRDVQYWCDTYGLDIELSQAVHNVTLEMDAIWCELNPPPKPPQPTKPGGKRV